MEHRRNTVSPGAYPVCGRKGVGGLRQKLLKELAPSRGAERLRRDFALPCSAKAILRVWRQHNLIEPRRRKHRVKRDLRAIKQQWRLFQQLEVDTKDLFDIPEYWLAMNRLRLPRCQYTAREVVSGLVFVAYAEERSLTYARLFMDRILEHLVACGVDVREVTIQTDNGVGVCGFLAGAWAQWFYTPGGGLLWGEAPHDSTCGAYLPERRGEFSWSDRAGAVSGGGV